MNICSPLHFFQAIGRSTGAHGAFRDYQIDAVTLNMFAGGDLESSSYQIDLFTRYGRSVYLCSCSGLFCNLKRVSNMPSNMSFFYILLRNKS